MTTCMGNCCSSGCLFVLSYFPRDVLDEIWDLIESVSEDFPAYVFSIVEESLNVLNFGTYIDFHFFNLQFLNRENRRNRS